VVLTMEATIETPQDIEKNPAGVVRRWLLELKLADKREADWRKKAQKAWDRYRQKDAKKHSFNILWSNTETLRPAIYNSLPSPDVRRRYKDADPIGKACSEVLSRSLEYGLDTTDFDTQIKETVLDLLLPGRGVARVRYVPSLRQVGAAADTHAEDAEQHEAGGEALEGDSEELEWEQTPVEHVQWDDFRMGAGKEWCEVPWIAFRHRMTREELIAKFPECGDAIPLDSTDDSDVKAEQDSTVQDMFKTAEVWEIWNKDTREVIFIASGYKDQPCLTLPDPLNLQGFWPTPRPLYAIEDSASTVPVPLYELYREQADELDRITYRINKLVDGLKMRGIYDSTITELSEVMKGQDNDLIAASNVTALIERGGLEKAIWFMPIEQAAKVLQVLYQQREAAKQVIYEITGISDILRGATNASETATAQQIKANWGSARLKRLQSEVGRYIRDLLRIQGEIIGERFQPETLATMTGLQFMTAEQKQQAQMQAQQSGQPAPQLPPSWDEIIAVLRDDKQRTFKVDVETDSTVAASVESDMQGLKDVLGAIAQTMQAFGPAVQQGALPVEAVKEILLTITRRAKMGNAVEDALDKIQQPPKQGDPAAEKAQADAQAKQQQMQMDMQLEQMRLQMEQQANQQRLQAEMQMEAMREHTVAQREERQAEREAMLAQQQMMQEQAFERFKAMLEAQTKVEVAEISAGATLQASQISAAQQGTETE
jgi:hypothetical protein